MNKRQVIILWVIALILGVAVAAVKLSQNDATRSTTKRGPGQMLFESFPAADVATVEIQGINGTVTLAKKDGKWTVAQRDGYSANNTYVNDFIRTLGELKVTRGLEAGPSFAPRFGMDESAAKAEDRGLTAVFKDGSGKEIAKVSLGKNIGGGVEGASAPGMAVGRYIRNHADETGFYAVGEMFPSVSDEIKRWLADGFVSPEKIQSIALSQTGKSEPAWKLTRETEEAEFKLEGAAPTEVLDTAVTGPLKSLFSYAQFEDVVPKDKVGERTGEGKRTATITTFEGFTYILNLTPAKPGASLPAPVSPEAEPPATDNFLVTVDVTAELPKERKKEEDEKPEDAKTKDTAFTDRLKALTEKLAKEKAFTGITFEVSKSTVDVLLKERDALITKATPPPAEGASSGGNVQKLPGGMIARPPVTATTPPIEAVTPPISVPVEGEEVEGEAEGEVEEETEQ